ncbi:zinc finger protein 511 [Bacillus rossius redtenbacheri]|uniref:zinc finger protein 511 n=1 Tax=Bacillus rossius redtenbacheri TaxID=93214 RepID=UPI002FDE14EF
MQALLNAYGVGKRHPEDPFFEEGDKLCKPYKREGVFDVDDEDLCHEVIETFSCTVLGCHWQMKSLLEFEAHYNSVHRYTCAKCKKHLPTPHLLDLHVAETHDSFFQAQAERQPMYCCYVESCQEKFSDPPSRRSHCVQEHKYPADFRFDAVRTKHGSTPRRHGKSRPAGKGVLGPRHGIGCEWHTRGRRASRDSPLDGEAFAAELRDSLPQ